MKCCDINSGMLRETISIERATRVSDTMGGVTTTWAEIAAPRAYIKGLSGGERFLAMRVSPSTRKRAVIRFVDDGSGSPEYTGADRVIYKGKTHSIESVIDIEERKRWIEIMLVQGTAT